MGKWGSQGVTAVTDWYGGQIQQIARLEKHKKHNGDEEYQLRLQPLEMRRSNRLTRFLGSRRVLQIRIPEDTLRQERDKVLKFLRQKFVLCGRIFLPTPPKDNSIYLIEINEDYQRLTQHWAGDQFRISYSQFVEWHNPIKFNSKQVRFSYLLSGCA